jgi:hypothetical protein
MTLKTCKQNIPEVKNKGKKKKDRKPDQKIKELGDNCTRCDIYRKKGMEEIFEVIKAENFQTLMVDIKPEARKLLSLFSLETVQASRLWRRKKNNNNNKTPSLIVHPVKSALKNEGESFQADRNGGNLSISELTV